MNNEIECERNNCDSDSDNLQNSWLIIPRMFQKNEIIHQAHQKAGSHLRCKQTYDVVIEMGYYWNKMIEDIKLFIFRCDICQSRTTNPQKHNLVKHIKSRYPGERFQADTVYLSDYIADDSNRYLLTMVDHFSKFGFAQIISNKKKETIKTKLIGMFGQQFSPKMLHTDNGKEFDNKQLRDYLEEKGIEYRKGRPYNPRSQGSVEAFNRTIQNFLIRAKDMKGNNFNLEESVNEFILYYNQRKHSTHGYKPSYIMQNVFLTKNY